MLWLNSKQDRPDFKWFQNFMVDRMREGIRVERPIDKEAEALQLADEAATVLRSEYGIDNPNSPKQVIAFMESLDDDTVRKYCIKEDGKLSSAADGLVPLADLGVDWALQILKYRTNNGIITNITSVMSCSDLNGLIHPEVSFQKTNRISYKVPALMNINKEHLWTMVRPYKEGDYIWSADVKNQEPWIMAHITKAKRLIELAEEANESGGSIYKAVYNDIFKHPIESEEAYAEMKVAWNMLTYGGSLQGLQKRCSIIDASAVYNYFNSIKELKDWRGRTFAMKRSGVQGVPTVFGTMVYTDKVGGALQRSLMDLPIQGTGADILALLVKHINDQTVQLGISDYIKVYYTRHDEIIFEVDKAWQDEIGADSVRDEIANLTEHRIDDWVPFRVDVEQLV